MNRLSALLISAVVAFASSAHGGALAWYTNLDGSEVVPPSVNSFTGIGYFGLTGSKLSCLVYCTSNHGVARLHIGAPGTNGPEIGIIPVSAVGAWLGTITLDAGEIAALDAGLLYVEVTAIPSGVKDRGQLVPSYATYGVGCPGSAGVPTMSVTGGVAKLGGTVSLVSSKGVPGGLGLLFVSLTAAEVTMTPGCDFLVDPVHPVVIPIVYGATGAWSSGPLTLPANLPVEVPIHLQVLTSDPGAANGIFGASPRFSMTVFAY